MFKIIGIHVMAAALLAPPVWAQDAAGPVPSPPPRPADRAELRHQIYVMEGALARAVQFGASQLNRDLRSVAPEMFLLAGDAQARGVYLEGYGIFFDVAVPMLRQSMMWSLRMMLQQDDAGTRRAISDLRRHIQNEADPAARQSLESAIARLEAQASPLGVIPGPAPGMPSTVVSTQGAPGAAVPAPPAEPSPAAPWLVDTNRVYTESVQRALIDAMIDFSAPMNIGAEEWLTVAARDNERRDTLAPQDPYEEVVTILLRIRGADLREYRASRIDKAEARRRVRVTEF
jgi:hypothetical protein